MQRATPTLAGQKIREHRRATHQKQSAFGYRYGVTLQTVVRWEKYGSVASTATAAALARDGVCALEDWGQVARELIDGAAA